MMDDERDMTEDERREARATLERAMLQIPRFNRQMFWFVVVILLVLALIYNRWSLTLVSRGSRSTYEPHWATSRDHQELGRIFAIQTAT
jgi:hypothetical protein